MHRREIEAARNQTIANVNPVGDKKIYHGPRVKMKTAEKRGKSITKEGRNRWREHTGKMVFAQEKMGDRCGGTQGITINFHYSSPQTYCRLGRVPGGHNLKAI